MKRNSNSKSKQNGSNNAKETRRNSLLTMSSSDIRSKSVEPPISSQQSLPQQHHVQELGHSKSLKHKKEKGNNTDNNNDTIDKKQHKSKIKTS